MGVGTRARGTVVVAVVAALAVSLGLAMAGSGSLAANTKPKPKLKTCPAEGTALSIVGSDNKYDKDCMAVPASQDFTIDFDNQDGGIPHNVSLYDESRGEGNEKELYKGKVVGTGGREKVTYRVPALPEGRYVFRCDPHPEFMVGDFLAGNPPPPATTTTQTTAPPTTTTTTTSLLDLP